MKCARCGAWPMAVRSWKASILRPQIIFKCSKCGGSEEIDRLRYSAASSHAA
jgi:DNA-directed RNA polymerase subunit RPC12/RpoP